MTVTLGPFFLSSAVEGPGNSRKKTEPTMRAAAKSTFMFRSERRSIHREKRARPGQPRAGRGGGRGGVGTGAATERGRGGDRGSCRPPRRRRASFPPSGSAPDSRSPWGAEPRSPAGGRRRGLVGGCHVTAASLAPQPSNAHLQERDLQKAAPLKERGDWVSEETTKPSMQSGTSRGPSGLGGIGSLLEGSGG